MWNLISKVLYRVLAVAVAIPVGRAVKKLIEHAWTAARPGDPPKDPKKVDTGWPDAITWAAISGVGSAAGALLTAKGTAGLWRAVFGVDPPGQKTGAAAEKAKRADAAKA